MDGVASPLVWFAPQAQINLVLRTELQLHCYHLAYHLYIYDDKLGYLTVKRKYLIACFDPFFNRNRVEEAVSILQLAPVRSIDHLTKEITGVLYKRRYAML
jgi:hypothetical protein